MAFDGFENQRRNKKSFIDRKMFQEPPKVIARSLKLTITPEIVNKYSVYQ